MQSRSFWPHGSGWRPLGWQTLLRNRHVCRALHRIKVLSELRRPRNAACAHSTAIAQRWRSLSRCGCARSFSRRYAFPTTVHQSVLYREVSNDFSETTPLYSDCRRRYTVRVLAASFAPNEAQTIVSKPVRIADLRILTGAASRAAGRLPSVQSVALVGAGEHCSREDEIESAALAQEQARTASAV